MTVFRPVTLWFCLAVAAGSAGALSAERVDFRKQIRPLFQRHCYKCHGPQKSKGGLRLDDRSAAIRGGDSGISVLLPDPNRNPIYKLITTSDPMERMPQDAAPLPNEQIQMVRRWIEQGAEWPAPETSSEGAWWHPWYDHLQNWAEWAFLPFQPWLMIFIFVFLVFELGRSLHRREHPWATGPIAPLFRWISRVPRHLFGYGLLVMMVTILMVREYRGQSALKKLKEEKATFVDRVNHYLYGDPPKPLLPDRPPTIGGTFYRGNNERNRRLFNNGAYRTATFGLSLKTADGTAVRHGRPITDDRWYIHLEVKRSPGATPRLYTQKVMDNYFISRHPFKEGMDRPDDLMQFTTLEPGERWSMRYPVQPPDDRAPSRGTVYIFKGTLDTKDKLVAATYHYGIGYHLQAENGKLSDHSRLWLGNLFRWNPAFAIPPKPNAVQ
ncbi:MAG: c-type cytochrome domain-containing protein, partial [Phycisphaeraceae bacterium]|nr:c-type cytochrome domain-containing protein [Phycisphaeraceae bacterium]